MTTEERTGGDYERRPLVDRIIPDELLADEEDRFRSRVLVAISVVLGLLLVPIVVVRGLTISMKGGVVPILVADVIAFSLPFIMRATRSYRIPSVIMIVMALVVLALVERSIGVFPVPALLSYMMIPLLSGFLIGLRGAVVCTIVAVIEACVMYSVFPIASSEVIAMYAPTFLMVLISMLMMTTLIVVAYEVNRKRVLTRAHAALSALRRTNHALTHARARAEDASNAKSDFLARMSHELRTPLNAIIGYGELLVEDFTESAPSDREHAEDAGKIVDAGKHLLELINEVLDLSKIEAGELDISPEEVALPPLMEKLRATVEPLARRGRNTYRGQLAPGLTRMRTDSLRLRQILLNLLGNACKFTEDGTVELEIAPDPDRAEWVRLRVRDTGIGMTEEQLARAFEPFVQVSSEAGLRRQGTGLGLALTRRLCARLGGEVTATSAPDEGSTFTVRLPVAGPPANVVNGVRERAAGEDIDSTGPAK